MPTSVPNFNFLAQLVSDIWGGSQNKKRELPMFQEAPWPTNFLYRMLVRINDYNCARFQLASSISYWDMEWVQK